MRILVISSDFLPTTGGIAVFIGNLCRQLHCLGHHVDVLTQYTDGCLIWDNRCPYRVYRYDSGGIRPSSLIPLWSTLQLYWKYRYDVIFLGHFIYTHALGALMLCKLQSVPYVILSHGNDLCYPVITTGVDKTIFIPLMLKNASLMLGNSRYTVERIREMRYKGPAKVLHPGVDIELFHPGVNTTEVMQKYGLNSYRVIFTAARLTARKNIEGVLRAFPLVLEQIPHVRYLIAGQGKEENRLRSLVRKLGVERSVQFLGYIENEQLPAFYCAASIFVMPSYEIKESHYIETFGMTYLEANACGIPVIGSRVGGVMDAVIDGVTGLLVEPYNVDEIAAAIIRLLTNRELAHEMGENGRQRVEQDFTWEKVGERLERYFESVVRKG